MQPVPKNVPAYLVAKKMRRYRKSPLTAAREALKRRKGEQATRFFIRAMEQREAEANHPRLRVYPELRRYHLRRALRVAVEAGLKDYAERYKKEIASLSQ